MRNERWSEKKNYEKCNKPKTTNTHNNKLFWKKRSKAKKNREKNYFHFACSTVCAFLFSSHSELLQPIDLSNCFLMYSFRSSHPTLIEYIYLNVCIQIWIETMKKKENKIRKERTEKSSVITKISGRSRNMKKCDIFLNSHQFRAK